MKQYKGYYIDGFYFTCEADIDCFILNQTIDAYRNACIYFSNHISLETSIFCDDIANRLHDLGLSWDEIEQVEIAALAA